MRHEQATRLRTPGAGDVWWTFTARGRTKCNAIARLRPTPQSRASYPTLSYLAHAVIAQAVRDATPEAERGGKAFRDDVRRRRLQCESLMWLTSSDPDLVYWANLAEYPLRNLHARFRPLLMHFIEQHADVATTFALPTWTRPCA